MFKKSEAICIGVWVKMDRKAIFGILVAVKLICGLIAAASKVIM